MAFSISPDEIKELITALGYKKQNNDAWSKRYPDHNCTIEIDFDEKKIIYPRPIELGDKTTSNFAGSENFVVLECVDRLLTQGYKPEVLELEKKWPMGKQYKGKLDILVKDADGKDSYLMIECKTWGNEYNKEKKRMQDRDGGQLFSYYQQDKNTKYLCLYTSRLHESKIEYNNDIVQMDDSFKNLGDVKEVYTRWNKQFSNKGIFDADIRPYRIKIKPLKYKDLKSLEKGDDSRIYNHFLEILRHNVVSDKGNAFNKIFNLFLCKILDENKNNSEQMDFQWIEGEDTNIKLLSRLNDLYKKGMKKYLQKEITDYTPEDIKKYRPDEEIYTILQELRLYKNQEFAFTEVFNKASFEENARIVKEVVQLLQGWQIRYSYKQQFLGDFFELLLNTGFKQESGQFFSPVPLVRFIIQSLPVDEVIQEKIRQGEDDFLPYVIDFACGSGHFLTEMMDVLQDKISLLTIDGLTPSQQKKLKHLQHGDFAWADKYVYGIERDYRLVKTAKLACFLHGDGEAKIAHASGLAPFNDKQYKDKLKLADDQINPNTKNNPQFDILVANPPYSVKGFRSTVRKGDATFDLFKYISDASSEIEVLFIERMTQLIKPGGYAAIILPQSILSNAGNYAHARKIMLEHFHLKSLVLLGNNAFMATGTNTVVFFLKKRGRPGHLAEKEDYRAMAEGAQLVVVDSGEKEGEKRFLGYEFSARRGSEGIKPIGQGAMVDEEDLDNPGKANSYILRNMREEREENIINIDASLKDHVRIMPLADCFDWEADIFTNVINTKKKRVSASQYPLVKLEEICTVLDSKRIPITKRERIKGNIPYYGATGITDYVKDYIFDEKLILVGEDGAKWDAGEKSAFIIEGKSWVNNHAHVLKIDSDRTIEEYVSYCLCFQDLTPYIAIQIPPKLNQTNLKQIKIPLPPMPIQQAIVEELNGYQKTINGAKEKIESYVPEFEIKEEWERVNLGDVFQNITYIIPPSNIDATTVKYIGLEHIEKGAGQLVSDFTGHSEDIKSNKKQFKRGDILYGKLRPNLNKVLCADFEGICSTDIIVLRGKKDINPFFYHAIFLSNHFNKEVMRGISGIQLPRTKFNFLKTIKIPFPPLEEQQKIAARLNAEQTDIESQKMLIKQMEEKIQQKLGTLWQEVE